MIGGLYGIALGRVFFAESMFHRETDASKIVLVWLLSKLNKLKFNLFDTQFINKHLKSLGCIEIDSYQFEKKLISSLNSKIQFTGVNSDLNSDWDTLLTFLQEMREIS